jgi:Protein of unknown function (DUF3305)
MHSEVDGLVANPTPDPVPVKVLFVQSQTSPATWRVDEVLPAWDEADTGLQIRLFPDEAEGYYLNVTTQAPVIFVHWRLGDVPQALFVTLSYNEAGRLMDGGEMVDTVAMPDEMQAWLTQYVNLIYQPEQKKKKGGRNRPSFMKREEFGRMVDIEKGQGASAEPGGKLPPGTRP